MKVQLVNAALLGAATVLGFAPFYWFPLPVLTLALLILLWQRARNPRAAGLLGFSFGMGFFLTGVSWVYISLHDFGAMPAVLAAALTLVFCICLSLYPALVGYFLALIGARSRLAILLVLPSLWTLSEWARGALFTDFPWNALGYSQIPVSPLAGFAPILGIYGTTFALALSGALLASLWNLRQEGCAPNRVPPSATKLRKFLRPALALAALWIVGALLRGIEWTTPAGDGITVSLIQGNVPQEMKWREDKVRSTLQQYYELIAASDARLTILPETALPLFLHDVPADYLESIREHARTYAGDVLIGIPERTTQREYYNSVFSFGASPTQVYRKSHLVPFGEFVPLKPLFGWFLEVTQIPLLDFARGAANQRPLAVAGERVAVNICYEDVFGQEIIRQLPEATVLANVSNVAWFGRSLAPGQHLQISQARALETGRYMVRATNTGMTAIIDQRGKIVKVAVPYTNATVTGRVQGYTGATPYVRWGDAPILALSLLLVLAAGGWLWRKRISKIEDSTNPPA